MSQEVHIGRDGWLFLVGGSNQVLRYYTEPDFLSETDIAAWVGLLGQRAARAQACGARFLHFFAPDKLSIYPEHYAGELPYFERRPSNAISQAAAAAGLSPYVLDASAALHAEKPMAQVYRRTDTHWTYEGSFAVYRALCATLGAQALAELAERPFSEPTLVMDLGGKLDPAVTETTRFHRVLMRSQRVHANGLAGELDRANGKTIGGLLVGSHVVFRNEAADAHPARILVFGDSFSEVRPVGLTALLAETFREVHFFWSSSVDFRQVERIRPDVVISEIAERFANVLPEEERDLEALALDRLAAHHRHHQAEMAAP